MVKGFTNSWTYFAAKIVARRAFCAKRNAIERVMGAEGAEGPPATWHWTGGVLERLPPADDRGNWSLGLRTPPAVVPILLASASNHNRLHLQDTSLFTHNASTPLYLD